MHKKLKITQTKSSIGRLPKHKSTLLGLGLKRIRHTVFCSNTPSIRGMIKIVSYMVKVQEEE
ncbi:50S ribosomal protein L30 [Buchnera aphidicola (Tetraneura ulmi)]|uniref:50S ribosomal protein L30 n=1 Tax=Buchnera aphidicola TaxID=9 RepID=UPI003464094F